MDENFNDHKNMTFYILINYLNLFSNCIPMKSFSLPYKMKSDIMAKVILNTAVALY